MPTKVPDQNRSNSTFLAVMAVLSGVQVLAGGISLLEFVPSDVSGILMLVVAAANAGITYYLNGKIVSLNNVVAYQPNKFNNSALYAGGAANERTGSTLSVNAPVGTLADKVVPDNRTYPDGV